MQDIKQTAKIMFRKLWGGINNENQHLTTEKIEDLLDTVISLAVEQREKEVLDMVVKEIDEIPFSKEIQDIYESKNNEYVKRSLSGLLQVKSPIDTNKGYEFVYVTKKVEEFIVELVNSLLIQDRKDITDSLKQKLLSTNKE